MPQFREIDDYMEYIVTDAINAYKNRHYNNYYGEYDYWDKFIDKLNNLPTAEKQLICIIDNICFITCPKIMLNKIKILLKVRKNIINTRGYGGETLLMKSCVEYRGGTLSHIKNYINAGADVNLRDDTGNTALTNLFFYSYIELSHRIKCMQLLLYSGADVDMIYGACNDTILIMIMKKYASNHDWLDIITHIMELSNNITYKNNCGYSAYDIYITSNNLKNLLTDHELQILRGVKKTNSRSIKSARNI